MVAEVILNLDAPLEHLGSTAQVAAVDPAWGRRRPTTALIDGTPPTLGLGLSLEHVPQFLMKLSIGSIVLIDAPLTSGHGPFRECDLALIRSGIPCLPIWKGADRGTKLPLALQNLRPDLHIYEAYPFQIYKVLAWLYAIGYRSFPPMGSYLGPEFRRFRPPSYKTGTSMDKGAAVAHASEILRHFCGIHAEATLENCVNRFRADVLDTLFMIGLGRLARDREPWVLALGETEPSWLVLGDTWLLEQLSKSCLCRLYSDTTKEG